MLPVNLEKAMFGVISTPVLHLADRYEVFTHLAANGPTAAADIAEELHIDLETTERMLLVLTAFEIVQRAPGGRYSLPDAVHPFLDPHSDRYIGGFITHLVQETAGRTPLLDSYLQHGKRSVDGSDPQSFASLYRDDQATGRFLKAMWDLSFAPSKELAALAGLAATTHLIDVGGASGPFAVAALQHAPGLRATVFDLPEVESQFKETRSVHELGDRLTFIPGDFFTDELPEGDCIAFGYILSDWPDDACVQLLSKAYRACRDHGRVLVMDRLFDESRQGPLATAAMNLTMHLETQGRHRTADEYITLLKEAGFSQCETRRSDSDKHLVAGYKAEPRQRHL
ncbi:methyltransferase [Streptomonospora salina]|uniref:Ubiquinone/menaquinone biosynthesis C-methylase UbiE n=1 Tax=Streptomonospora salina TaxID=104205 RepID=A0A841EC20_9ACTN|nr:methyltransferase [Streptomonospora salina]MBB5999964.1 ubiquinone/menaquinone biosynthesis C-methylase UbiE [Streptomonospora salina]